MNVLMVLSSNRFPPDRRVEREARDLIRVGHRIFLVARRIPSQPWQENVDGVNVLRVPLPFQKFKPLADLCYFLCQRYLIFFFILYACVRHRIDVLHVHDLPYALATTVAGRILGLSVIFDMHEWYVSMLRQSFDAAQYRVFKPLSFLLLGLLQLEERLAVRWSQAIVVVADEHMPRVRALGAPSHRIMVVTNTDDADYFASLPLHKDIINRFQGRFSLLYAGAVCPLRGLDTAIRAIDEVRRSIPDVLLIIVGDGPSRIELEALTKRLSLEDHVCFEGYQAFHYLPSYITASTLGLIAHISTPHTETTMPNKIFQFMMLAKPVIVSNLAPLERVVREARCGWVFTADDLASLSQTIMDVHSADDLTGRGKNGQKAVRERYNWEAAVKPLLAWYAHIPHCARRRQI